jgi:glycerol-3-phosphate dehydrogenase subunit C
MSDERDNLPEIRFQPTDGLTTNPNEPKYWDRGALAAEIERTFELCHSCRMCFKFCQSFPTLFEAVDSSGGVRGIPQATIDRVVDECFQCKLCYTQCPYTEAEGHEFKLDFPRLMLRAKAVRRRAEGISFRDRMLSDPDRLGRLGSLAPALANWGNTFRPHRVVMEKLGGIHRDKLLPDFASPTFESWFRGQVGGADETPDGTHKVVLFGTCFANYNRPELGKAAFSVLRHNDCRVACPRLVCCGMPALDAGDLDLARSKARRNVATLLPWVEKGYAVAVVNPTCSLMIRQEYPELLDDAADSATAEAAKEVAGATRDVSEFLFELRRQGHFREDFRSTPNGPVAYHAPCHLRMQSVGFRGRDLMRRIPGVTPKLTAECCGHDGTWAMKTEYFDLSLKNGAKAFDGMRGADAEVWASDCPLAAVQFRQACGREVLHPLEVLERAYRADGFPHRIVGGGDDDDDSGVGAPMPTG